MWTTTLTDIRFHGPCTFGWETLLRSLGKTKCDEKPLSLLHILASNGLDDALWSLRAVEGRDKEMRLFAVNCARQVQHLMTDPRSLSALEVAERFANGKATDEERTEARAFALDAIQDSPCTASLNAASSVYNALNPSAAQAAYFSCDCSGRAMRLPNNSRAEFLAKQRDAFIAMVSAEEPDTGTEEDFWDVCIDDEVFDEDEEQGEDPLEGK